ncbi:MAG: hypothetical protein ACKVWV_03565 [Planctomycetota bacterium]
MAAVSAAPEPAPTPDEPLETYQRELLDIAFDAASALPLKPHIKNRSRAQDAVVAATLELGQPQRAARYLEEVVNWRRGTGYADVAYYLAQKGDSPEVRKYLQLAARMAEIVQDEATEAEPDQEWRRDRIRAKVARTHLVLGETDEAARIAADVTASEQPILHVANASVADADAFDRWITIVDDIVKSGDFERTRGVLLALAQFADRLYDDAERRARAEEKIRASWGKLPLMVRIEVLQKLAEGALAHSDAPNALEIVHEIQGIADSGTWTIDARIHLGTQIAALRYRAGDVERAREGVEAALSLFESEAERMSSVDRSRALRMLAETFDTLEDAASALATYRRSIEAGAENPNGRPRAEELSATCTSMATQAVEPDAALWTRMREIRAGLGYPW